MTLGFDDWLSADLSPMDESFFASRAWALIQRKPVNITIRRGATELAAQTVRVEKSNTARELAKTNAVTIARDVVVFGVKGHPNEDIADTDIQNGDEFGLSGELYVVQDVVQVVGGVQASCIRKV